MKRVFFLIVLGGLLAGCASIGGGDEGGRGMGGDRGTTGVSTGADAGIGNGITGSEWAPPP